MTERERNERVQVLLVEDNPADVRLTEEAVRDGNLPLDIHVVTDGVQAMDFLYKRGDFNSAMTPELIFLDLNMPRKDGREVLTELKEDPNLRSIPVVVLSTAGAEKEVLALCDGRMDRYYTKPVDLDEFLQLLENAYDFWRQTAGRKAS